MSTRENCEKNWEVWDNVDVWDNERSLRYMWLKWEKCQKARYVRKRDLWEKKWAKCENVRGAQ